MEELNLEYIKEILSYIVGSVVTIATAIATIGATLQKLGIIKLKPKKEKDDRPNRSDIYQTLITHSVFGMRPRILILVNKFLTTNGLLNTNKGFLLKTLLDEKVKAMIDTLGEISNELDTWKDDEIFDDAQFKNYCFDKITESVHNEDKAVKNIIIYKYGENRATKIMGLLEERGYGAIRTSVVDRVYIEVENIINTKLRGDSNPNKMMRMFSVIERMFEEGFNQIMEILKNINGELDKLMK